LGNHFYTTSASEVSGSIAQGREMLEGIACYVLPVTSDPQSPVVPFLRLYKGSIDDHFYTTDQANANIAQQQDGYTFELIACNVFDPNRPRPTGTFPLFRAFNPQTGEHFYTADQDEFNTVLQNGFQKDGIGPERDLCCFVYDLNQASVPQGAIPFYRLIRQ